MEGARGVFLLSDGDGSMTLCFKPGVITLI